MPDKYPDRVRGINGNNIYVTDFKRNIQNGTKKKKKKKKRKKNKE